MNHAYTLASQTLLGADLRLGDVDKLAELARVAKAHFDTRYRQRSRRTKWAQDWYVEKLLFVWESCGGATRTSGPIIHFIQCACGPVWQAVRASSAVPGVLPPFFTKDGEMLVDGGLMDNVPLAPMKALKTGPNVVVALGTDAPTTYMVDYDASPGPRELIGAMLNPFSRRRLPQMPSILQVITLSMVANRRPDLELGDADILVRPDLPDDLRFTSWERHNEVFLQTYRGVAAWIRSRTSSRA